MYGSFFYDEREAHSAGHFDMMADFDILVANDVLQSAVFSNPCFLHNHAVFNDRSFSYVNSSEQDRILNFTFDDAAVSDNRLLYPAVFSVFYRRIVFIFV